MRGEEHVAGADGEGAGFGEDDVVRGEDGADALVESILVDGGGGGGRREGGEELAGIAEVGWVGGVFGEAGGVEFGEEAAEEGFDVDVGVGWEGLPGGGGVADFDGVPVEGDGFGGGWDGREAEGVDVAVQGADAEDQIAILDPWHVVLFSCDSGVDTVEVGVCFVDGSFAEGSG